MKKTGSVNGVWSESGSNVGTAESPKEVRSERERGLGRRLNTRAPIADVSFGNETGDERWLETRD